MKIRSMLAGGAVFAGLLVSTATQAETLTGSEAAWIAGVGGNYSETTNTGIPEFTNPVSSVPLADGTILGLAGSDDLLLHAGQPDWLFNLSSGYTGDIIDTTTNSETISIPGDVSALGMAILPDIPPISDSDVTESIVVTLSDGSTQTFTDTYDYSGGDLVGGTEQTQFVGFFGGNSTSMTITMTDGTPINTVTNPQDFAIGDFVDVPEPMSLSILFSGLVGLRLVRRRARG
jgi:hypothetical protein